MINESSVICGCGFILDCSITHVWVFMKKHERTIGKDSVCENLYQGMRRIVDKVEGVQPDDMEEFVKNYEQEHTYPIGKAVADIIALETGICCEYCPMDENHGVAEHVMFAKRYLKEHHGTEHVLTDEGLVVLCMKYMLELGISAKNLLFKNSNGCFVIK